MSCPTCNKCKKAKCGCEDQGLTTPTSCEQDTLLCPTPEPCSETFSDCCVIHNGPGIVDLGINQGDSMCEILQLLVLNITNPVCNDPNAVCKSPLNVQAPIISPTTAKITWGLNGTPTNYAVEYKEASLFIWFQNPNVANTTTTDTIGGLTPDTYYHVRVKAICATICYSVTILIKTKV